jgi:hypothetical protein
MTPRLRNRLVTLHKLGITSGYDVIKMAAVVQFTQNGKQMIQLLFIHQISQMRYQNDRNK